MRIFSTDYPGRIQTATAEYPRGTFRDKSAAGAQDGTPIADAERLKDWHGAFYGIMEYAGLTPNGNTDTATSSQIADAIFNSAAIGSNAISEVSLSKLSAGDAEIGNSSSTLRIGTLVAAHAVHGNDFFAVSYGDPFQYRSRITSRGLQFNTQDGTEQRYLRSFSYDISGATWSSLGSGYYQTSTDIHTGEDWSGDMCINGAYVNMKFSASNIISSSHVKYIALGESSGKIVLMDISIYSGIDPASSSLSDVRICGMWGQVLSNGGPL